MIFMIVLSAQLEGMQSRADKSWKLIFGTQELTPEQIGQVGQMQQSICFIAINSDPFSNSQKEIIENTKVEFADTGKTPSERLRGVFYVKWKDKPEGYENFHDYYIIKMEKLINHYKSKLPH
jgi:hypothetical protein